MTTEYKKDFLINILFIGSIFGLIVLISRYMFAYLFPFIIGVVVALTVQRPAKYFAEHLKIKKQICAVLLTVLICISVFFSLFFIIWILGERLLLYVSKLPDYITGIQKGLSELENSFSGKFNSLSSIQQSAARNALNSAVNSFGASISTFLSRTVAGIIKNLPAFLIGSIVTVVASCYIAKDFDRLKRFVTGIVSKEKVIVISRIKSIFTKNSIRFIKGYGIIAVVTFLELSLAFYILGINKPIVWALFISLVDALPVLGVGTIIIPWAIIELLKSNLYLGFGLITTYAIIVIIRNFIEPKIIGEQIGINPIFTLISMFLGLKLSGFAGMIIFPLSLTVVVDYYKTD